MVAEGSEPRVTSCVGDRTNATGKPMVVDLSAGENETAEIAFNKCGWEFLPASSHREARAFFEGATARKVAAYLWAEVGEQTCDLDAEKNVSDDCFAPTIPSEMFLNNVRAIADIVIIQHLAAAAAAGKAVILVAIAKSRFWASPGLSRIIAQSGMQHHHVHLCCFGHANRERFRITTNIEALSELQYSASAITCMGQQAHAPVATFRQVSKCSSLLPSRLRGGPKQRDLTSRA